MSRVSAFRPPVNGGLVNMADTILAEQLATERGHKAGLAAAASAVEHTWLDIDGGRIERTVAYEVARRAISAYIHQIHRSANGGTR